MTIPDAMAEVLRLADLLDDAAEDYRFVIPQFHAGNRRSMKTLANTIDDVIAGLRALSPTLQAMADNARRLDALEREVSCGGPIVLHNGEGTGGKHRGLGLGNTNRTLREAIDSLCDIDAINQTERGE